MKDIQYCPNHLDKKIKAKGLCRSCYEKGLIKSNPEYRKKQQENSRNWHKKNKEHKKQYDASRRVTIGPRTEEKYLISIKSKFNLSKKDYYKLVEECGNKCTLCGRPPHEGKRLHLDHDHNTNEVRGLLCTRCNWYLATIENDPSILEKIKAYLKYE